MVSQVVLEYRTVHPKSLPQKLRKFANSGPECIMSGPVRYRIAQDYGLNNGLWFTLVESGR